MDLEGREEFGNEGRHVASFVEGREGRGLSVAVHWVGDPNDCANGFSRVQLRYHEGDWKEGFSDLGDQKLELP